MLATIPTRANILSCLDRRPRQGNRLAFLLKICLIVPRDFLQISPGCTRPITMPKRPRDLSQKSVSKGWYSTGFQVIVSHKEVRTGKKEKAHG